MPVNYYRYYKEIKNRLVLIFFTWILCFNTCYYYKEIILFMLINSSISFLELEHQSHFIFTNVTEIFYIYFDLVLFISNQITLFSILYQTVMFFSLGLHQFEFRKLKLVLKWCLLSWLFSSILLFEVIIPFSWKFFLSFHHTSTNSQIFPFFFEAKLNEYLQYLIGLYYVCFISCQFLTTLIICLINISEKLKETKTFRKLFYLIFVVFSTLITPPDILSQLLISSVLILTYEILIFLKGLKINRVTN